MPNPNGTYGQANEQTQYCAPLTEICGVIPLERRRVHINKIPESATEQIIRRHIRRTTGFRDNAIEKIDLPEHIDGRRKAHGFVEMNTERNARELAEKLDGSKLGNHKLRVKVAQEGVRALASDSQASVSMGPGYAYAYEGYTYEGSQQENYPYETPGVYEDEIVELNQATLTLAISPLQQQARVSSHPPPVVNGSKST
jgi:RNA recognition motif-containing protein